MATILSDITRAIAELGSGDVESPAEFIAVVPITMSTAIRSELCGFAHSGLAPEYAGGAITYSTSLGSCQIMFSDGDSGEVLVFRLARSTPQTGWN